MHITCEHNARYVYNGNDVEVFIYNSKYQQPTIIYEDDFFIENDEEKRKLSYLKQ